MIAVIGIVETCGDIGEGVFSPLPNYKNENFLFDTVVYRVRFNAKERGKRDCEL